jgi:hypothetical protein
MQEVAGSVLCTHICVHEHICLNWIWLLSIEYVFIYKKVYKYVYINLYHFYLHLIK